MTDLTHYDPTKYDYDKADAFFAEGVKALEDLKADRPDLADAADAAIEFYLTMADMPRPEAIASREATAWVRDCRQATIEMVEATKSLPEGVTVTFGKELQDFVDLMIGIPDDYPLSSIEELRAALLRDALQPSPLIKLL